MTAQNADPRCPYHATAFTHRDTPPHRQAIEQRAGVYYVGDFELARQILRSEQVAQAGFMAEGAKKAGGLLGRPPVLFSEGETHHEMRRATARYFTPKHVAGYQPLIAKLADELVGWLWTQGPQNLDDLSLELAVAVAAQVLGLTDSLAPGMNRRIANFVEAGLDTHPAAPPPNALKALRPQADLAAFFALDVRPAVARRRKNPQDDLISYLLERGYSDLEILTECLTYGTAGMVTTREFITAAAWHLLQTPPLRAEYLHAPEKERFAILHEILRLEPVVTQLFRRVQTTLEVGGLTIPAGALLALNVQRTNTDTSVVGADAGELCPHRELPRGVQPPVLAFGDGHHRCPGAFLAVRESDVFLRRLLIWRDLEVLTEPRLSYNETVKGYELRGLRVGYASAPA